MYICVGILLILCILCFVTIFFKRRHIIFKIHHMDPCTKLNLLNSFAEPFGFHYDSQEDIITSNLNAWQRNLGYCSLFDRSASRFQMVFDCEPVYFNYDNCTWRIEFWKGQYGINIGGEIGIYQADSIVSPKDYDHTCFHCVDNENLMPVSMELNYKGNCLFSLHRNHWWLTGFQVGTYCQPEDLTMNATITFPHKDMLSSFVDSLMRLGYSDCQLDIYNYTVSFCFSTPHTWQPRFSHQKRIYFSQCQNFVFSKLFLFLTRPFTCTVDKILFLYFFLPSVFRHILHFRKASKHQYRKAIRKK